MAVTRHVPIDRKPCYPGRLMQRLATIFGALMLVVVLWTGSVAHAADRVDCIPAATEAAGHFKGDGDEWPSTDEKGAAHHHGSCSGHQFVAPAEPVTLVPASREAALADGREAFGLAGRVPDNQLRPPIA